MTSIAPGERILTAITLAEQATQAAKEAAVARAGIGKAQYNALLLLSLDPGISGAELARRALVTPQAMSETVGRLERSGWVRRVVPDGRRQARELHLTPSGQQILAAADAEVVELEESLRRQFGADRMARLRVLLADIQHLVEPASAPRT